MSRPTTEWTGEERADYAERLRRVARRLERAANRLERGNADAQGEIALALAMAGVLVRHQDEMVAP